MGDQVVVWSWSLEADSLSFEAAEALLSDDEKARGRAFVAEVIAQVDQRQHLAALGANGGSGGLQLVRLAPGQKRSQ